MKEIKKKYRHSTTFYRKLKASKSIQPPIKEINSSPKFVSPTQQWNQTNISENFLEIQNKVNDYSEECYMREDECQTTTYDGAEDHSCITVQISILEKLRTWYHLFKESHSSFNYMLGILRSSGMKYLPTDCRTIIKTPRLVHIEEFANGQFWYNGIKSCLNTLFSDIDKSITLPLIFNVDGIPPFNASPLQLWPILFRIEDMPYIQPMAIVIFCGDSKPPLKEFLKQFVDEINDILQNSVYINGHQIKVLIRYFVCDTPARNFIIGTVGFNAAHGCMKCTVVGEFDKKGRHMSFPRIDCPLRTDESFRNKTDPDHHKYESPLLELPIDIVEDVIIADSLHLFDLGIMRKCLYGWMNGSYNFRTKWSAAEIDLISDRLGECNASRPAEIHRAVRRLKCLKFWKGTEYRTFLLYLGPVVLKDFLCAKAYHNFLTLFCAVTIISCKRYLSKYVNLADCLLKDYVEQFIDIYGIDSISSNIHNAIHVINDVKKFGSLSEISAYPFENYLGHLKSLLRNGNRPLAQIAKRVSELSVLNTATNQVQEKNFPYLKSEIQLENPQLLRCEKKFKQVFISNDFMLSNDIKNKWFLTKGNDIISMVHATSLKGKIQIYGSALKKKFDFFELPIKSSYLNIYTSDAKTFSPKLYSLHEVKCKLVSFPYKNNQVFLPLIHTLDIILEPSSTPVRPPTFDRKST